MTPNDCPECAQAQLGSWRSYRSKCPECQIRMIANMPQADRGRIWDEIEAKRGRDALECVKERVGLEIIRMRLLREGRAPVE